MQPKFTSNKSNLIKLTEEAKRKSRQRLIGSIVLLIIALVILLNVTANVKPIAINPDLVEIKQSSAPLAAKATASAPQVESTITAAPEVNKTAASQATASHPLVRPISVTPEAKPTTAPATPERALPLQGNLAPTPQHNQHIELKAKPKKSEPNPEDILNGISSTDIYKSDPTPTPAKASVSKDNVTKTSANKNSNYIQFAALSSMDKADKFQQILANHGIQATIQPITTTKGTLYRLRAGPYPHSEAVEKLQRMANEGYSGIITGN